MKCVITGDETNMLTKKIPLSREGRSLLQKITDAHNEKIADFYVEKTKKDNPKVDLNEEYLRKLAPKISKSYALTLLSKEERDIMETRDQVLGA